MEEKIWWNLYHHTAAFVLPELIEFRKNSTSWPDILAGNSSTITDQQADEFLAQWHVILDKMIFAMKEIVADQDWEYEDWAKDVFEGCELFGKYFVHLWD
ncbi:MAG: hypothetical protein WBP54_04290 [Pelodictyon phaeoclathratiforme]